MATFDNYIRKLRDYSSALGTASIWNGSNLPISGAGTERDFDYIYEFFCLMAIVKDLSIHYHVQYDAGNGKTVNCFPKAPANKKGRPKFIITLKTNPSEGYQVCAGTFVSDKRSKKRAPDISFQNLNADQTLPKHDQIIWIYDSKRKRIKAGRVTDGQYSSFGRLIRRLELGSKKLNGLQFDQFKGMNGNCIITNGKAFSGDAQENQDDNIIEVEFFDETLDLNKIRFIG